MVKKKASNKKKNKKNDDDSKKPRKKIWTHDTDAYREFARICAKHEWQFREKLPRAGEKCPGGPELDRLIEKGLGDGQPFSWDQVKRKLAAWKAPFETNSQEDSPLRQLDQQKFDDHEAIYKRLKRGTVFLHHFSCTINISN